jgi:hypothetical protein
MNHSFHPLKKQILKKKRNGSSRLTEAASFSVIIWDKGFTRPVETELPKEEEDEGIPLSPFFCVDALEDIEEPIKDKQESAKGFGAK